MKGKIRSLVETVRQQWMSGSTRGICKEDMLEMALIIQELEENVSELREELMVPKMKKDRKVMTGG